MYVICTFPPSAAPHVSQREVDEMTVEEGADFTMDCFTDGQPTPNFRWIKDGITLRNSRKYHTDGSSLTIRHAVQSDEGLYECFAENTLGFARHSIRLRVNGMCAVCKLDLLNFISPTVFIQGILNSRNNDWAVLAKTPCCEIKVIYSSCISF